MAGAGDIAAVSIPFTAGVAAATVTAGAFQGPAALYAACGILMILCVMAAFVPVLVGDDRVIPLLYFFLGAFCSFSFSVHHVEGCPGVLGRTATLALSALRSCIASIPFPHDTSSSLASALLTGERAALGAELRAAFRDSGASHILALSGLHLGMIYLIINRLLSVLGNSVPVVRSRSILVMILCTFYTIMTGAGPSIVRALTFIIINEAGKLSEERRSTPARTLFAALTVQLAIIPSWIADLGFQLSYLAMTGIVFIHPGLKGWYPSGGGRPGPMRRIWESVSLSVSCQILTAPLIWLRFGTFPVHFLLANLLALPLVSAIMALSVTVAALHAAGICPGMLVWADDALMQALVTVMRTIAGM